MLMAGSDSERGTSSEGTESSDAVDLALTLAILSSDGEESLELEL